MICPNCGTKIKDGKMYCEGCGLELEIISDVDIDVEMKKTMQGIAKEQYGQDDDFDDIEFDDDDNPSILGLLLKSGTKLGKFFYVIIALAILVVLFIAIRMGIKISHESSLEYQVDMAKEALEDNNYLRAISYYEKAYKLDSGNSEYKFQISEIYLLLEKYDDAIYTLTEIAENDQFEEVKRIQAYKKLFSVYKDMGDYSGISETLNKCTINSVINEYSGYLVEMPSFSYESGTYEEKLYLRISSETNGTIYYTLDGTEPTQNSLEYNEPILLEYGSYTVKAVVVNDYAITSPVVTNNYLIDVAFSFSPKVEPESGEYEHTFLISVDVPVMYTCYYTIDGTTPNKESLRYSNPIPAQEGNNLYKFVIYASDGTQSEIIEKNYNVVLNTTITAADAVILLNKGLIERGYLDESGCHREGYEGTYLFMYSTIYPIEGMGDFYFVVEYVQDDFGNNKMTGMYYAIDCYNGMLYTVNIEGEDGYTLSPL